RERARLRDRAGRLRLARFFARALGRQEKNRGERPDAEAEARRRPQTATAPARAGDHAAKNGVEDMHEDRGAQERCRIEVRRNKIKSREITEKRMKAHRPLSFLYPLTILSLPVNRKRGHGRQ